MATEGEIAGAMGAFGINRDEAETVGYLGDSVYASFDGYQVWIRTYNGVGMGNPAIALEPSVMRSLIDYATRNAAVSA